MGSRDKRCRFGSASKDSSFSNESPEVLYLEGFGSRTVEDGTRARYLRSKRLYSVSHRNRRLSRKRYDEWLHIPPRMSRLLIDHSGARNDAAGYDTGTPLLAPQAVRRKNQRQQLTLVAPGRASRSGAMHLERP